MKSFPAVLAPLLCASGLMFAPMGASAQTIAYEIAPGTVGNQEFGGSLGLDFNVIVPIEVIEELVELGQHMLTEPVHVLAHVPEVLEAVGSRIRMVLITKGDLVHQTRKVTTSGLEHHFTDIEILLEKDPESYAKIMKRLGVTPERFLMVGNSVKSDILPVLALGAYAVHVPYHITWSLEQVDRHEEEFAELGSIADLPAWLGLGD